MNSIQSKNKLRLNITPIDAITLIKEMFSYKLFSRRTKERLYSSYLRSKLIYACETWTSTKGNEEKLKGFKRKIYRHRPIQNVESERFERRKNDDYKIFAIIRKNVIF